MVNIKWRLPRGILKIITQYISWKLAQTKLTIRSLTYNEHMSSSYVIDTLLEPIFWIVDNFSGYLGKVFVFCVTILTSVVVAIAYWIGLPFWWQRDSYFTIFLVVLGNWLLLNIVFHYYMGVTTSPGYPPHGTVIAEAASICKKCITPKPPRTHHCSVCDRCVLAMDHHCPWLNNCVGYFNARHFYLYMAYMVAGVSFLIVFGFEIGYQVLWVNDARNYVGTIFIYSPLLHALSNRTDVLFVFSNKESATMSAYCKQDDYTPNNDPELIGHPVRINQTGALIPVKDIVEYDSINFPREHVLPIPVISELQLIGADPWKRKAVIFMAVTSISVLFALGTLVVWHGKNISRGETSIEGHINAKLRASNQTLFRNPYNFGKRKNWKIFLGLVQGRTFIRHVLLPSAHRPVGTGLTWHTVNTAMEDWP